MRRWWWLGLVGLALGVAGGLLISQRQDVVYQASARLMFTQPQSSQGQGVSVNYYNDKNIAATLSQLIVARPVLDKASNLLGSHISSRKVKAAQVGNSRILQVDVLDGNPRRAAAAANAIADAFIEHQAGLRSSIYATSEMDLQAQIDQVKKQIDALQNQSGDALNVLKDQQTAELENRITQLRDEINTLQEKVIQVQNGGTPVPGFDRYGRWGRTQPTLTVDQMLEVANDNNRLDEARLLLTLYQNAYVDLTYRKGVVQLPGQSPAKVEVTLAQYQQIYSNLLQNLEAIRLAKMSSTPDLTVVESALPPEQPILPNRQLNLGIGAGVGLFLAIIAASVLVWTDEVFRTPEEAQVLLRLPLLAMIRKRQTVLPVWFGRLFHRGVTALAPFSPRVEAIPGGEDLRFLQFNLEMATGARPIRSLLVTGSDSSNMLPWLAVQLARVAAYSGQQVLLIDADMRRPQVNALLNLPDAPGLSEYLTGSAPLVEVKRAWENDYLTVITSGCPNGDPADQINRASIQNLLNQVDSRVSLIVINSPPLAFSEASVLAASVDGVLMAVELNKTRSVAALAAMEQLHYSRAKVVGMVVA